MQYLRHDHPLQYEQEGLPVMQSTGLLDRNGKEIFEEDVMRHPKIGQVWLVQWDSKEARFDMPIESVDQWKVIGNRFENPELVPH